MTVPAAVWGRTSVASTLLMEAPNPNTGLYIGGAALGARNA